MTSRSGRSTTGPSAGPDVPGTLLAARVAAALAHPTAGRPLRIDVGSISFAAQEWEGREPEAHEWKGHQRDAQAWGETRPPSPSAPEPPGPAVSSVLLVHGVTASWRSWWRIGPALAAAGHRVVAVDSPGHGSTRGWVGDHSFAETALLLADFARGAGLATPQSDAPRLAVIGHSWGSLVAASLPLVGLKPHRIVLLDPPALTDVEQQALLDDPTEQPYASESDAAATIAAQNPGWHPDDVAAKAEQLTQFDAERVRRVVLDNRWDGGLTAIAAAIDAGVSPETYAVIRGVPAAGGLTPDDIAIRLAELIGKDRVVTLEAAPHTPQRTHPEALTRALLRAIA